MGAHARVTLSRQRTVGLAGTVPDQATLSAFRAELTRGIRRRGHRGDAARSRGERDGRAFPRRSARKGDAFLAEFTVGGPPFPRGTPTPLVLPGRAWGVRIW
jgi:hypothetical protein